MKTEKEFREMDYSFLETYEKLDVQGDWKNIRKRMKAGNTRVLSGWLKMAAVIAALLSVGFLTRQLLLGPEEMIVYSSVNEIREIGLPDGSMVVMNKGASLSHPAKFRGGQRLVILKGEAWFEVAEDSRNPFVIDVNNRALIRVLGTRFNVMEDSTNEMIGVQVGEGSVAFFTKGSEAYHLILSKGDQAVLNQNGIRMKKTRDTNYLSWKTGILSFDQSPLAEVIIQLEKQYGTSIECDPVLSNGLEFTSTIDNQDLQSVLEEICMVLGLKFEQQEGSVRLLKGI